MRPRVHQGPVLHVLVGPALHGVQDQKRAVDGGSTVSQEAIRVPQVAIEPIMTYDTETGELPEGRVRYEVSVAGHA